MTNKKENNKLEERDTKHSDKYGTAIYLGDTLKQESVSDIQIGTIFNDFVWRVVEDEHKGEKYFCCESQDKKTHASLAMIAPISKVVK